MTIYPAAQWRPLGSTQPGRMSGHDLVILHTMVGTLWGTDSYFKQDGYGGTESHFGVGYDGEVLQWVDLECRADANLDANDNAISIETADMGTGFPTWGGSDVPAWTSAQVEAIALIVAWCCDRWNIPCVLIPDSKPGRRGVGYHRQGVDPYRASGGEKWSTSYGKVCPGDRRVGQVPLVIERANAIMKGKGDWFDMADETDLKNAVRAVLNEGTAAGQTSWAGTCKAQLGTSQGLVNQLRSTEAKILTAIDADNETYAAAPVAREVTLGLIVYAAALILEVLAAPTATADETTSAALAAGGALGLIVRLAWAPLDRALQGLLGSRWPYGLVALAGIVALVGYLTQTKDSATLQWAFGLLLAAGALVAASAFRPRRARQAQEAP